jgi:predicted AAA+ superfamily ATPase
MHLLKWVHFRQDTEAEELELRYFRDVDGREVDFVLTEKGTPKILVETKWSDAEISWGLLYLKRRFPAARAYQLSAIGKKDFKSPEGIRVCPAVDFLAELV